MCPVSICEPCCSLLTAVGRMCTAPHFEEGQYVRGFLYATGFFLYIGDFQGVRDIITLGMFGILGQT